MKRFLWGVGLVAVVVLTAVALWMLRREASPRLRAPSSETAAWVERGSEPAGRTGRVISPSPPRMAPTTEISAGLRVWGDLRDPDGSPLDEARLSAWCLHPDLRVTPIGETIVTDEHGRFEAPACRHRVCIELHDPSWVPREPWVLEAEQSASLVAAPVPRLVGRVEADDGTPMAGVRVTALPPADDADPWAHLPVTVRATTTDDEGTFAFPRVVLPPCGPCEEARGLCGDRTLDFQPQVRLAAAPAGYAATAVEVDVEAATADPVVLRVTASTAEIRGTLTDRAGRPFADAYVVARSQERTFEVRRAEAGDGTFVVRSVGVGAYDLEALVDGQSLARDRDVRPGEAVTWIVDRSAALQRVVLEVRDARGPVAEARIDGAGPWAGLLTDTRGHTPPVDVLAGSYRIRVHIPGARRPERVAVQVPEGEEGATRTVSVQVGGS